jgi:hypothetical protein
VGFAAELISSEIKNWLTQRRKDGKGKPKHKLFLAVFAPLREAPLIFPPEARNSMA